MGELHQLRPRTETPAWGLTQFDPAELDPSLVETEARLSAGVSELRELLGTLREHTQSLDTATATLTYGLPTFDKETHRQLIAAIESGQPIALRRPNDVPLHSLLRFGSVLTLVVCLGSIGMWLVDLPSLINPFAALLGVVIAPFFYLMGDATRLTGRKKS
jgi:hypothetical protein